jgi:hypothetical protein
MYTTYMAWQESTCDGFRKHPEGLGRSGFAKTFVGTMVVSQEDLDGSIIYVGSLVYTLATVNECAHVNMLTKCVAHYASGEHL